MKLKNQPKNLQTKKEQLSELTKTEAQKKSSKENTIKSTYHQTCKTLPYQSWIDINVDNDLSLLTIEGKPSGVELTIAWASIVHEYSDLIRTEKSKTIFEQWKKIEYVNIKISLVHRCLDLMKDWYYEDAAVILMELGYDYVENLEDRTAYRKTLEMVDREAKNLIVLRNQYIADYKSMTPGSADVLIERTRMDYQKELVILSKFLGRRIDPKTETTLEVAAMINQYIDENKPKK